MRTHTTFFLVGIGIYIAFCISPLYAHKQSNLAILETNCAFVNQYGQAPLSYTNIGVEHASTMKATKRTERSVMMPTNCLQRTTHVYPPFSNETPLTTSSVIRRATGVDSDDDDDWGSGGASTNPLDPGEQDLRSPLGSSLVFILFACIYGIILYKRKQTQKIIMKKRFTYILLLTTMLLTPMGVKAESIGNIHGVHVFGDMNSWTPPQPDWSLYNQDGNTTPANHWARDFYLKANWDYYFRLYIWYGDGYAHAKQYRVYDNFPAQEGEYVNWNIYEDNANAPKITTIQAESGYVKVKFDVMGDNNGNEEGGNSRLAIYQSAVPALSPTLTGATKVGSGYSTTLTAGCSGGSGTGYNYTYSATAGSVSADGVFTAPTVNAETTVTITVTAQDKHSQLSELKATKSLTVTVYPMTTIPVYINTSETDWGSDVQVHYWWDGFGGGDVDATLLNVTHATSSWRVANVPMMQGCSVNIQAKKQDHGGDGDYSENITNITGECAYYIYESDDAAYKHTWRNETEGELATVFYMVASNLNAKWHYSNRLSAAGMLSYYTKETASDYTLYKGNDIKGYTIAKSLTNEKVDNVYEATFDGTTVTKTAIYPGDYYIRTLSALGQGSGWKAVKDMSNEEKADAKLTYFAPNINYKDSYNYYWLRYVSGGTHVNAAVANEYNDNLTVLIGAAGLINVNDAGNMSEMPGNVRFGYNPTTNELSRTIINGSSSGTDFVSLGTSGNGLLAKNSDGTDPIGSSGLQFTDVSNWVYEQIVYAKPGATAWVRAAYGNGENKDVQYLFGNTGEIPTERELLGEDENVYKQMLVIYDYKTNRVTAGWVPTDMEIATNKTLNASLMIMRTEEGGTATYGTDEEKAARKATQVKFTDDAASLTVTKHIYTVLEITKENWKKTGGFFWISLPYDCYVKDIYGINDYGKKWTIQRYRGDKRAEVGWFREIPTFWANMKQTETAMMEADRGYVVYLNLSEDDFKSVSKKNELGEDVVVSELRLYFPSAETGITLSAEGQTSTAVPVHNRNELSPTDKRRVADDSNWNVIGVGGLQDMYSSGWAATLPDDLEDETVIRSNIYCYTWNWNEDTEKGEYTLISSGEMKFESTQAYMVQFGGDVSWTTAAVDPSPIQARKAPAKLQDAVLRLDITNEATKASDKTYLQLDEMATTEYDLNCDLGKIVNEGIVQIYTLTNPRTVSDGNGNQVVEQSQLAANYLPIQNQSVIVGVQAPVAGDYTFSIANVPNGVVPVLYDVETGNMVNLQFDRCTVYLEEGTNEQRFELRLQLPGFTTDCEQLTANGEWQITQVGNALLVSGLTEPTEVYLYDAIGRLMYQGYIQNELIPINQTGLYLLQIKDKAQRVIVR